MNDSFKENVLKLLSGSVLSQILWMLSMIVLTRVYLPEEFASYQIFVSTLGICSIVSTARYELAIFIPKRRMESVQLAVLAIFIAIIFALVCQIFLMCISYFHIIVESFWHYFPVAIVLVSAYAILYNWYIREKGCTLISVVVVLFPIVHVIAAVVFKKLFNYGDGLIYALIVARFVEVFIFGWYFLERYSKYFKGINWFALKVCAFKYSCFPKFMIVGGSLDNLSSSCPVFMLDFFYGKEITGYYSITMQALSAPSALVAKSLSDVFRQQSSVLYSKYNACKEFYDKNLKLLCKISLLVGVGIILLSPIAFVMVFGEHWRFSGELARYILPNVCLSLIASPLSGMYIVSLQQKRYLAIQFGFFIANVFGFVIGVFVFEEVKFVLLTFSIFVALVSVVSIYFGRKIADGKIK